MISLKKIKLSIRSKFDSYLPSIKMGDNPAPLHLAIMFKNFEAVVRIVEKGGKLDLLWRGVTPVTRALDQKAYDILEYLVKKGANVNIRTKDHRMEPPLFTACRLKQVQAVKILLQSPNIDVNQKDFFNFSALWAAACKAKSVELVNLLLDHGADINLDEKTPQSLNAHLFRTSQWRKDIIHLLIRRGCRISPSKEVIHLLLLETLQYGDPLTGSLLFRSEYLPKNSDDSLKHNIPSEFQENEYTKKWFKFTEIGPQRLKNLTIDVIRNTLLLCQRNINPSHVQKLPLPNYLKKKLLFEDIV